MFRQASWLISQKDSSHAQASEEESSVNIATPRRFGSRCGHGKWTAVAGLTIRCARREGLSLAAEGDDKMIPFIVNGKWDDPEVEDIAQFRDVNQDKDNLNAFNTWNAANEFARPFSVPPGPPSQALALLRTAFKVTI